mgnify:CR=1 FL=1
MAVKIRLKRMGAKKKPFYRLVAADSRSPRDGKFIETLGTHDPLNGQTKLDEEAILRWLGTGAIPTDTARDILSKIEEVCFSKNWIDYRINYGSNGQRDYIIHYIKRKYNVE